MEATLGARLPHGAAQMVVEFLQCTHGNDLRIVDHIFSSVDLCERHVIRFQPFADFLSGEFQVGVVENSPQLVDVFAPRRGCFEAWGPPRGRRDPAP